MIVSVHQPHLLPWGGYVNKVLNSDRFVWLHTVQYRKNYFQNRTRIKSPDTGGALWLTIPVHAHLGDRIDEVHTVDDHWRTKLAKTITQCYRRAPFFEEIWPRFAAAMDAAGTSLDRIDEILFGAVLDALGAPHRPIRVESLAVSAEEPTERLVEICQDLGATQYIAGRGGRSYMREDAFTSAGIEILWQDYRPELVEYPQLGEGFVPGLSVIDALFTIGPDTTRGLLTSAWRP